MKLVGVKDVMVRQVPFMLMLSPSWASVRMEAHSVMVAVLLPEGVVSRVEIAGERGGTGC